MKNTTQNWIFSLAKYCFSLQSFHIKPKIRNIIRLLRKSEIIKALKENKIREINLKIEFMYGRDHIIFDATLTYFTPLYRVLSYLPRTFIRKYTLLVIYYVNFLTCPTILTQRSTIFIRILKVWSNKYVCKISLTY